jgi:two-component system, OmpR family, copper resistance phosphate regulon response regulator CusR
MLILIAESDAALATFLERGFNTDHYAVDVAEDAEHAAKMALAHRYDAAILDLNFAQAEKFDVLRQIRTSSADLPILILANQARPEEKAQVLDAGADDVVLKPFAFSELSARVRALLRRGGRTVETVLRVDDLELNRVEHCVRRAQKKIELTPKEFALLEYLMRNSGRRVTRAEIIEHVWNLNFDTMTNVVDVYINYVRKKVDVTFERKLIHTVRGVGYQLRPPAAASAGLAAREPAAGTTNAASAVSAVEN